MSINLGIIASVSQGALQQSQVARTQDAEKNEAQARAQELRKKQTAHTQAVEDSYETTDDQARINEDEESQQQSKQQRDNDDADEDSPLPEDYKPLDLEA